MRRKHLASGGGLLAVLILTALALVFILPGSAREHDLGKFAAGDPDAQASSTNTPGEGPAGGWDAYLAAAQAYPGNTVPARFVKNAKATFAKIARQGPGPGGPGAAGQMWQLFGPKQDAVQPGVLSFSGATNSTASRVTVLLVSPTCGSEGRGGGGCTVWAGVSGGGVWRTNNALAPSPDWHQVTNNLAQNSVGSLTLDPTDPTHRTLYLGTGEPNRCSSGCEAGVGVYKSTDSGNHWTKLGDACVDNSTYSCVNHGDAFLGRAIAKIVVDPSNPSHLYVGSAQAVRGLSHVIGNGGTTRLEPGANPVGLYESTNGGATFTEVWNGNSSSSFGINDVGLDPSDSSVVYASAFDQGLWRRDSGAGATAFTRVFAPQFPGGGVDRTMFALTTTGGHTRIYLTEGTAASSSATDPLAANFWRTDLGDQSASTLLASQGACSPPASSTVGPQTYTGWQCLTSQSTASPYYATDAFCTGQCWYDQDVYTPAGMPDTVYVIGSNLYGEQPCNTKGVGCGNGRSNGREVLYSTTAGDPEAVTPAGSTATTRTFTDLSYDAQDRTAPWCGLGADGEAAFGGVGPSFACLYAPDGIHPDQHAIAINPNNPTQIFEGSDGGVIRTSGTFSDISQHCNSGERPLLGAASLNNCKRLLSRAPTTLDHVDRNLSSTLQFINVAIDPFNSKTVLGGTQDNGTWSNLPGTGQNTFSQVIYGDGGNALFDGGSPGWLANEFTGGFGDSNFENGAPTKWVIGTGPMVASGETFAFYWPQIGDPNPVTYNGQVTHPIYNGGNHVWRSWAFDAGTHGAVPQDTTPNVADYEANCPEFTTSGADPNCGDEMPLGGPVVYNADTTINHGVAGDLTGAYYGSDRSGGSISWLARDSGDHGTLWAATSAGRIFVSHNADASDPNAVTWLRIDSSSSGNSPTRFPSGITVDPHNANHAWISYSGYDAVTPSTPGHVFSVRNTGATGGGVFTNLNVEAGTSAFPTPTNDGDLPVADIVRDDATHTLYVATDFGVLSGDRDGTHGWHVTAGLPRYEVMHLAIEPSSRDATCSGGGPCARVLYAATHSQGIWKLDLGPR